MFILAWLAFIFFISVPGVQGALQPCQTCHEKGELSGSVHAVVDCQLCHQRIKAFPHAPQSGRVDCSACHNDAARVFASSVHVTRAGPGVKMPRCQECHGTHGIKQARLLTPSACQACHQEPAREYRSSIHGQARAKGAADAATCQDCHGGHNIFPKEDSRSPVYHLNLPQTCGRCHGDPELAKRHKIPVGAVYQLYLDSIHGRAISKSGLLVAANCSDCHGTHGIYPRQDSRSSIYRTNIPSTCGKCHAGITPIYLDSIHGQAVTVNMAAAPVCTDCHSAHQIIRTEGKAWKLEIIQECGTCHQPLLTTYRDTYHGKVTSLGYTRVARCSDCHGAHDILPAANPASRLSPSHIVGTCQRCHPGANKNFAKYYPHADYKDRARYPFLYYAYRFMTFLLVAVFGFFGIHLALWLFGSRPKRGEEK